MSRRDQEVAAYLKDVGAAVRREREGKGWSQAKLARRAGLSRLTVVETENGANWTGATLARLCIALDIAPETLGGPSGVLGQVARNVCKVLDLDLLTGKPRKPDRRRLPLLTEITGRELPAIKPVPGGRGRRRT